MKTKIILLASLILMTFNSFSQYNGATPWSNCFGINASCQGYECSGIKVITSSSNPVVVIVKKYGKVIKHAYISSGSSYTFEVKDGTYQVFFYYGSSWNSRKKMSSDECSSLYGGWDYNENVTKDDESITFSPSNRGTLTYTLSSVINGNFNTKPSSIKEAL